MRFFVIMGVTLFVIGAINFIQANVELAMKEPVYACSEVTKSDPVDVQRKCKK